LNLRPSGYEPDELPGCSTPRPAHSAFPNVATASPLCGDAFCRSQLRSNWSPVRDARARKECIPFISGSASSVQKQKAAFAARWFRLGRSRTILGSPLGKEKIWFVAFGRPGSDLLSRVLRRSTMGAGAFHGRVRNGNGCSHPAMTTRSAKRNKLRSWCGFHRVFSLEHVLSAIRITPAAGRAEP
jgi:hypothetical protein